MVAFAANYCAQYVHLFRDRQPLLLCPLNECGVEVGGEIALFATSRISAGFLKNVFLNF